MWLYYFVVNDYMVWVRKYMILLLLEEFLCLFFFYSIILKVGECHSEVGC